MKKIMVFVMAISILAFGYMSASGFAAGEMNKPMATTHEGTSKWVGKEVKNMQGRDLGTVKDFVKDSEGRISFAVVSYGGIARIGEKTAAIPYSALTYNKDKKYFTCDISKQQLESAPAFKNENEPKNRSFADSVYRSYGLSPFWTEKPGTMNPKAQANPEGTGATKGSMEKPY
jgi:sporulation protein YlmC with PRC-barrel domain